MSPELNGNPPSVTKRKKNRDKKATVSNTTAPANTSNFDPTMSNCNYIPLGNNPYHNLSIPDISAYFSYVNYSNSSEPMSLPVYPMNYPSYNNYSAFVGNTPHSKHSTLPGNGSMNADIAEYLSLPSVNVDQNDESSKRRFSDPGLPNESDSSSNSTDERLVHKLQQQINSLTESNRRLSREVMEMKVEINLLKQQQGFRHIDREYEPGMLADVIREVRDAARVREDALLARVKHIIEEKQLSLNHLQMVSEKNRNNDRISKLEEKIKNLSIENTKPPDDNLHSSLSTEDSPNTARQILELEKEALELRRELQETRAKKEEADQRLFQMDKQLSTILRRSDVVSMSDISENGKTPSVDSMSTSTTTNSTASQQSAPKVVLTGPVTDL